MIYVTGDLHGDFHRLNTANCPAREGDYVIVCGDFGGVWDSSANERHWLKWLEEKPFTTLFVCGNHENFESLYSYPVENWNGGKVHRINEKVIHLMRGQVFTIEGKTFFTMGGAASHDIKNLLDPNEEDFVKKRKVLRKAGIFYRVIGKSWWPQEMPSYEEYGIAKENLKKCNWGVDYIITHCAPTSIQAAILADSVVAEDYGNNLLTNFFEILYRDCDFKRWFHGHYHVEASGDNKIFSLYESFVALNDK